jgi:hypothetical protein
MWRMATRLESTEIGDVFKKTIAAVRKNLLLPKALKSNLSKSKITTECARDCDLYKLVSCGKFVNDILFSTIYKHTILFWGIMP